MRRPLRVRILHGLLPMSMVLRRAACAQTQAVLQ